MVGGGGNKRIRSACRLLSTSFKLHKCLQPAAYPTSMHDLTLRASVLHISIVRVRIPFAGKYSLIQWIRSTSILVHAQPQQLKALEYTYFLSVGCRLLKVS